MTSIKPGFVGVCFYDFNTNTIEVLAGSDERGVNDGGQTTARMSCPKRVCVQGAGNHFVADETVVRTNIT